LNPSLGDKPSSPKPVASSLGNMCPNYGGVVGFMYSFVFFLFYFLFFTFSKLWISN